MAATIVLLGLINIVSAGNYGLELGDLFNKASSGNHGVRGTVSVVNDVSFFIYNFSYDGEAPDAYFWVGTTPQPSPDGRIVPDELGSKSPLKKYENKNIVISLPGGLKISGIKWLSVWCRTFTANFGHVVIPEGYQDPQQKELPPLHGRAHKVSSGSITLIDSKTIIINDLRYDGNGPDAFFLVGKDGKPNGKGIKVPDERGRLSRLRGYGGEDIILRLPDQYTWFDVKWFALYCIMAAQNFGEVYIKKPLNIPISPLALPLTESSVLLTNCREIFPDKLLVRWKVKDDDIYIQLEGRVEGTADHKQYLAFGISGSEDAADMVGADVVAAHYNGYTAVADDYYLTARTQCAGGKGACPDVQQGGKQNVVVVAWRYTEGILAVTYRRRLIATEDKDKAINTSASTTVVAAIGLINSKMEVAKHSEVTRDLIQIDFGKDASKCDSLKVGTKPKERVKPWPPMKISDEKEFRAQIGPSGTDRGYTAITGSVGWGIAWWINGLLIPEITVKRGVNYTFIVEGGDDPSFPTEYHPFYITNNKEGGGVHEKNLWKQEHMVYAGVERRSGNLGNAVPIGVGRYCEYKHQGVDQSQNSTTFEEFKRTLYLDCKNGSAGKFTWIPDSETPDTVYYQCFTHRNLGWKIHVSGSSFARLYLREKWTLVIAVCVLMTLYKM